MYVNGAHSDPFAMHAITLIPQAADSHILSARVPSP
jgi:hypothetical protein